VSFTNFSLFIGVAMSITAFPLLARILVDSRMDRSKLGMLAIACAAIDDATAWWLLAIVVGVAQAQFSMTQNLLKLAAFGSYLVLLGVVIRPAILRWLERMKDKDASREATGLLLLGLLLLGLLASALLTEWMGISGIFGAFLLGAVVPHNNRLSESFRHKLEDVVHLLLPVFFAHTGVTSKINLTASNWWYCAAFLSRPA
jgi:Kef-type K+ transport system membrane component KefB